MTKLEQDVAKALGLGPTGQFPQGRMEPSDEGEMHFRIGSIGGKIKVEFGKPVAWIGMGPQEAVEFAKILIHHAKEAAKVTGDVLTIEL